ncbi:hypothetical protein JW756_05705 [Candidatus Woesearchaeota archaeon]|nr:hypothetical protein [Candidatus Woesearchaeota archaeon]
MSYFPKDFKSIFKGLRHFFAHTPNNTVLATSRTLVAVMENHQQKDGSIKIPKALWKYTGFKEIKAKSAEKKNKTEVKKKK